jgi:hypothetical protein
MLTPEDKKVLLDFAGPLFAQSKEIDSMYYNDSKPKTDGIEDSGIAYGIQKALERDFANSQAPRRVEAAHVPMPQYIPIPQHIPAPMPQYAPPVPQQDPDQMEFKFNVTEQEKTNTLLEAQNKLIKQLITKIDKLISISNESTKAKT